MVERAKAGALVGALAGSVLALIHYLGWTLVGFPFAPFDLFDWLARELPGTIITLWIDGAIAVLRLLHAGSTAAAAKALEQGIAVISFIGLASASGAAMFVALGLSEEPATLLGAIGGLGSGTAMTLVESSLGRLRAGAGSIIDAAWTVSTFCVSGVALGWFHDRWHAIGLIAPHVGSHPLLSRRRFLHRVAWLIATPSALIAAWAIAKQGAREPRGARWSDTHSLPNADAVVPAVDGTRAEFTLLENHYRVDIDTRPPHVDPVTWRLRFGGLVQHPREWTVDDLTSRPPIEQFITISCVSNPLGGDLIGTTRWTGVSLQQLLDDVQPQHDATHLRIVSADGFFECVSIETALADARVMLAYAWDGVPLPPEHGFPLRLYVPGVYGMKQPKWIVAIDAVTHWEPGYWVVRGWDRDGRAATSSSVDTARLDTNRQEIVAGGFACAGARRVSRVQVRVDDGEWRDGQLRDPLGPLTWTLWRAELPAGPGPHVVSVRGVDGTGSVQAAPFHSRRVSV
jgi:DMSO/TMAO reductase YedYZ molybdopterin-dependent catalytic subunit